MNSPRIEDRPTDVRSAAADDSRVEQPREGVLAEDLLVEEELLVEDVSIDGMCGVY